MNKGILWCDVCACEYVVGSNHMCIGSGAKIPEPEMILAVTDGPIIRENITIDQRYRFTKRIEELEKELNFRKAEISVYKDDLAILEKENAKMRQLLDDCKLLIGDLDSINTRSWRDRCRKILIQLRARECLASLEVPHAPVQKFLETVGNHETRNKENT